MSFLAGLFGRGNSASNQQTAAVGLQVQTSVQGKPIALIYGTTRVAPNLILYGDFNAKQQQSAGGKGGLTGSGGKGGGSGSYIYSASFQLGIGEGPINGIRNIYADKTIGNLSTFGFSFFNGFYKQKPWAYLLGQILPIVETHTIPPSGPHTITVNSASLFYEDDAVYASSIHYTRTASSNPGTHQYNVSIGFESTAYTFSPLNAGQGVTISYKTSYNSPKTDNATIPVTAPQRILISNLGTYEGFTDEGVVGTGAQYQPVSGTPGVGQYSVSGGVYTFNAANAGQSVSINYYTAANAGHALGYSGIGYVAAANFSLGNNPSLPNFNFEVAGYNSLEIPQSVQGEQYTLPLTGPFAITVYYAPYFLANEGVTDQNGNTYTAVGGAPGSNQYSVSGGRYTFASGNAGQIVNISYRTSIGPDADPSQVILDLLTNSHYGVGFPSAKVGSLSTYRAYCLATGLVISPCYDTQTQSSSMLDEIAKATNSAFVWSSGTLTLVPYGDQSITANGYTYTAPNAPEYSLTDDDFMPNKNTTASASAAANDDPVLMMRKRPADQYNSIKLEWLDRGNNYSPAIVQATDQAAITAYGLRQDSTRSFHMFCNGNAAQISVQLQLQRELIRNIFQFTLDQRYVLLDPMDIVAITDSNLGLNNQWVRILEITENDDSSLSFVAEEYLQGTGTAPIYSYQQSQGFFADYNADPGDVNIPVIFEPTAELAESLEVWMAVSGGPLWGGCEVWISQDNETYQPAGKITGPSRQGSVDAPLASVALAPSGISVDMANTLAVDISLSGGQLLAASQVDAQNLATLCYLGQANKYELLAYQNAALVSENFYDLTYLVRGAYGSPILAHSAGEQFTRLDSSVFKYNYTQDRIGTNLFIKLLSFNLYGGGGQSLADVSPFTFTLAGVAYSSPLPDVTELSTSYVANITQLSWDEVTDFRPVQYEVRKGASWTGAQVLGRVAHPPFGVQGNGTYWVAAYSQPVPGLQVYSESPQEIVIAGAQIVSNVIASHNEGVTGWTGTFGGGAGLSGNHVVLTGSGNILSDPDYLHDPNIFDFGGISGTGTYTIPTGHVINIGRIAPCSIIITSQSVGQHVGDNVLSIADYLNFQDLLDYAAQTAVNVFPNVAVSQDGTTWGAWQKWRPGSYIGMAFRAQMELETNDSTVQAILEEFIFEVDVPDRDDHYVGLSVPSGGLSLGFTPDGSATPAPFNGGPANGSLPSVQVTIVNAQAGDQLVLSGLSLSGCNLRVMNGGSGVARSVNVLAEGF